MSEKPKQSLPPEYKQTYDQMLKDLSDAPIRSKKQREITAFWPMRGKYFEEDAGLMVIGRAVNGWAVKGYPEDPKGTGWKLEDLKLEEERQDLIDGIRCLSESSDRHRWQLQRERSVNIRPQLKIDESGYDCPLSWVKEKEGSKESSYNTNNSAFWRVNKAIQEKLHPKTNLEDPWSSYLCWSNLYKVAPLEKGNPLKSWRNLLESRSIELLRLELETFDPKHVLVVAGKEWYCPFIKPLGIQFEEIGKGGKRDLVEGTGDRNGQRWVFAKHPQTKPEKQFTSEVVKAFTTSDG